MSPTERRFCHRNGITPGIIVGQFGRTVGDPNYGYIRVRLSNRPRDIDPIMSLLVWLGRR